MGDLAVSLLTRSGRSDAEEMTNRIIHSVAPDGSADVKYPAIVIPVDKTSQSLTACLKLDGCKYDAL